MQRDGSRGHVREGRLAARLDVGQVHDFCARSGREGQPVALSGFIVVHQERDGVAGAHRRGRDLGDFVRRGQRLLYISVITVAARRETTECAEAPAGACRWGGLDFS